jgi:hypothetical protein
VERRAFVRVLRGCHPDGGHFLPDRKPARRRAGWDLTLAAPKSVSLLGALTTTGGAEIAAAHAEAVDEVVGHFERRLLGLRRPAGASEGPVGASEGPVGASEGPVGDSDGASGASEGPVGATAGAAGATDGLVAAAFDHTVNAAGEPHLHTHLIVCNLGRDRDGRWWAISNEWWPRRVSLSAIYQLGLRHHLGRRGLNLEWRVREDGFADVVGVPRAAVRMASGRGRAVSADKAGFGDKAAGRTLGRRAAANAQTRRAALVLPGSAGGGRAGFGPFEATRVVHEAAARAGRGAAAGDGMAAATNGMAPGLAEAVRARLASQRSCFRQADVLVALAACAPSGLAASAAERWVDRFCADAQAVSGPPGWAPRWTTDKALAADRRLADLARRSSARRGRPIDPDLVARVVRDYPGVPPEGLATAQELVSSDRSLYVLSAPAGRANLLAHAGVLEVAAAVWRKAGQRAGVATSTEQAAGRWRTLTGLYRYDGPGTAEVVVVDHVDRRATAELLSLLQDIEQARAKAVLVEGGTAARLTWRRSAAVAWVGDALRRLDPGPAPAWAHLAGTVANAPGMGVAGCPTSAEAVGQLLTGWADAWTSGSPTLLVGMGYAESDGLNQAARAVLLRRGCISGPGLASGSRLFQAGDQVVALRRVAPDLPGGTFLTVVAVDPRRGTARVARGSRLDTLDRAALAHLGYGYAATPGFASRSRAPLMVLGPPDVVGPHRARVVAAALVTPEPGIVRDQVFHIAREAKRGASIKVREIGGIGGLG